MLSSNTAKTAQVGSVEEERAFRLKAEAMLEELSNAVRNAGEGKPIVSRLLKELLPFRTSQIIPVSFTYNPRDRSKLQNSYNQRILELISARREQYAAQIANFIVLEPWLKTIPNTPELRRYPAEPFWYNKWIPAGDAISIYGFLKEHNPSTYLEVGSGNSTKFARRSIQDHGLRTKIISIDPQPRAEVNEICDVVHRQRLEDSDLAPFADLKSGDIVLIDNSHRVFQNSDATVFLLEILPYLPVGCIVAIHDIFLPHDYPPNRLKSFYSEQYLFACTLLYGFQRYEIMLPNRYCVWDSELRKGYQAMWKAFGITSVPVNGSLFWIRVVGDLPRPTSG